jgi:glutathione S-transferase
MTTGKGMRLYDYELSGNCYKVRLLLHWLGLTCTRIPVDFHPGRAHRSAEFIHTSTRAASCPCWRTAICACPMRRRSWSTWPAATTRSAAGTPTTLPPAGASRCGWPRPTTSPARWRPRACTWPSAPRPTWRLPAGGRAVLRLLDDQLAEHHYHGQAWLAAPHADGGRHRLFPLCGTGRRGRHRPDRFPALQAWTSALRHQPGFLTMPGILDPAL